MNGGVSPGVREFGPYRLLGELGRGGMGVVHRALDTRRRRVVALKMLPDDLDPDPGLVRRFEREALAAARLSDPHIVPIHDFGEIDGRLYIDMQLVEGRNLADLLAGTGRLDPARAVKVLAQAAAALDTAHAHGLVHRDVKPSNLLVREDREDFTYLLDFGIAHVVGTATAASRLTRTGTTIGTLAYMAPERFAGSGEIDGRTDVYALTCVLFEMLTGERPFPFDDLPALLNAHLNTTPPAAGLGPGWQAVIERGMAKDPDHRYRTAGALASDARLLLAGNTPPATTGYPEVLDPSAPTRPSVVPGAGSERAEVPTAPVLDRPRTLAIGGDAPTPARRVPEPGARRRGGRRLIAWTAVAMVVLLGAGAALWSSGLLAGEAGPRLVLEAATDPGPGPFTADLRVAKYVPPAEPPGAAPEASTVPGSAVGLYRSKPGFADCNRNTLSTSIAQDAALRRAWTGVLLADPTARVQGDPGAPAYIDALTPALLTADVRVLDHSYARGLAEPFDAVLQAGTAVLVDVVGVPRVRCISGSPLAVPGEVVGAEPVGQPWPGIDATAPVVVGAGAPVAGFEMVDGEGGAFRRPVGTVGAADVDPLAATAAPEGFYFLTGDVRVCAVDDCSLSESTALAVSISDCTPTLCRVAASDWEATIDLTRVGEVWRATGQLIDMYAFHCDQQPLATSFALEVAPSQAARTGPTYSATSLTGTWEVWHAGNDECLASNPGDLVYDMRGPRTN